jgi:hypothetical protein
MCIVSSRISTHLNPGGAVPGGLGIDALLSVAQCSAWFCSFFPSARSVSTACTMLRPDRAMSPQ